MTTNSESIMKNLRKAGYTKVVFLKNKPNSRSKPHFHTKELKIVILRGTLKMTIDGVTKNYTSGDIIRVPKRAMHMGVVGKSGVDVVEGNR